MLQGGEIGVEMKQMGYTLETSYSPESDEEKPSMAYAPGRRDRGRKETDGVHSGD